MPRALSSVLPALLILPSALAEGVRIVEAPQLAPFADIQSAVDAAAPGQVLVVAGGTYDGFSIDGKALTLVGARGLDVVVRGQVQLTNLPAGDALVVSGLRVTGAMSEETALVVSGCAGHVRFEGCTFEGGDGDLTPAGSSNDYASGGDAVVLVQSEAVVFAHCDLVGGAGEGGNGLCFTCTGGDGGDALRLTGSRAALYQTTLLAGGGGDAGFEGGDGGNGATVASGALHAVGSSFAGGQGGEGLDFIVAYGGDGGDGLHVVGGATTDAFDCTFAPGAGGTVFVIPANGGQGGSPTSGPGSLHVPVGESRDFSATHLAFDDEMLEVTVEGVPGDLVYYRLGVRPTFLPAPDGTGVRLVARIPFQQTPLMQVPTTGSVVFRFPLDTFAAPARILYLQGFGRSALGEVIIGSPLHVLAVDTTAAPDCNGNGTIDLADTIRGTSSDCFPNLVPDECDPDCNANGTPDNCDIAAGTAPDCNGNGVPDECDVASGQSLDCNGNGVPDACDIATGASPDVNGNAIPDECEPNATYWVDAAAAPGGDGSLAAPFRTIGGAVAVVIGGDEVVVRDGVYAGPGNRDVVIDGVDITLRSENGSAGCVVDLQSAGRALSISNTTRALLVEGFTFRNGLSAPGRGGVIAVSFADATIRGCVFRDASSPSGGGALALEAAGGKIEFCVFQSNAAAGGEGGAIRLGGNVGGPRETFVERCLFGGNTAEDGGAIFHSGDFPLTMTHCAFFENEAARWGGAVAARGRSTHGGDVGLDHCLLVGNDAADQGGAVAAVPYVLNWPPHVAATSCTFTDNSAASRGGALALRFASTASLDNSIAWGNTAPAGAQVALDLPSSTIHGLPTVAVSHSDVELGAAGIDNVNGVVRWLGGNLELDPQFADPDGPDDDPETYADNDYRPLSGSPVNDAGDAGRLLPDVNDVDGDGDVTEPTPLDFTLQPRFHDDPAAPNVGAGTPPVLDMGCLERN